MRGLVIGAVLLGGVAHADPPDDAEAPAEEPAAPVKDPKIAKKWLQAAKALVAKGDAATRAKNADDAKTQYGNAITAFEKSIEAGDDLSLNLQIAAVEEKLGRIDLAARYYKLVTTAKTGVTPSQVKQAQAKYDDATTKVGLVTLTVVPDGTTITTNGEKLGVTPLTEPLIFMPGDYTLTMSADNYVDKETEIKVEAGSESDRKIELEPRKPSNPNIDSEPVVAQEPPPPPPSKPSMIPVYVAGGAGVILLGVAVGADLTARSWHNTFVAPNTSKDERDYAKDHGKTWAHVGDASLIGGVVGVGVAAGWYFLKVRKGATAQPEKAAKVDMVPWVQPDAGGLTIAGVF